ncbi:MAG: hypothetical protein QNL43_07715 [Crocinitomicaceae bacterium]|jgi:hypothetical protein|tara:strand:+ start:5313 stop:6011 length:699 start_codon:yes stop_codon:yes gene_type:complete
MNNFYRRILYYGIGFGIGLLFVFFFFNNRGCSWLPENRVKEMIISRIVFISDTNLAVLKNLGIQKAEISKYLEDADVDFSKSKKRENPKIYHLEGPTKSKENFVAQVVLYEDAFICELLPNQFSSQNASPSKKGLGTPVHYPSKKNLFYSDSSAHTNCQRKALGIEEDSTLYRLFIENGRINILNSDLAKSPKPVHSIVLRTGSGREANFFSTYFKEKARIYKFVYIEDLCP